jgi:hypothetical protein
MSRLKPFSEGGDPVSSRVGNRNRGSAQEPVQSEAWDPLLHVCSGVICHE